jgi:GT2 family glycosyltransferase
MRTGENQNVKPVISIVIPVFNGLSFTKTCLKSLHELIAAPELSGTEFKVIVVDDGSKDGTAIWITENFPSVHLLYGNGNLWWSGGINMGTSYALRELNSDYILWWNNDIKPADNYFLQAARLIKENDDEILIGSKIYILNSNIIWGMGGRFDPVNGSRYMCGGLQVDSDAFRKPFEVDWFPGMGTIIHRKVFERIGMLDDKNFPQYHGDSDFTYRAKIAGFKLIAFPELVIYNDNTNTGLIHRGSFRNLYKSLTSIKSNFNIKKELSFYRKHARSPYAYYYVAKRNFLYIGGFFKWKFLNFFGIKKPENAAGKK